LSDEIDPVRRRKERAHLSGRIAAEMDVAKSDFSQMRRSDLGLIKNV